jgi:hypothetical protein
MEHFQNEFKLTGTPTFVAFSCYCGEVGYRDLRITGTAKMLLPQPV